MAASDFPTAGDKLKKLIQKSVQMPISFGFNPGLADEDDEYFAAHPRKTPELLGKLAQNEGAGTKSAYGTFTIDASELHLTCFRTLPQLAKRIKKYLKQNKISLNVVVMDPDGNVLESDIELLDGWEESLKSNAGEDDDGAPNGAKPAPTSAKPAPTARAAEPPKPAARPVEPVAEKPPEKPPEEPLTGPQLMASLGKRVKLLQPKIALLTKPVATPLMALMQKVLAKMRGGDPDAALAMLDRIEAAVAVAPVPVKTDPRVKVAHEKLRAAAEALKGKVSVRVLRLIERSEKEIGFGRMQAALSALRVAGAALQEATAARAKWTRAAPAIAPLLAKALESGGLEDPEGVRAQWGVARAAAEVGDWVTAVAELGEVLAALRQMQEAA